MFLIINGNETNIRPENEEIGKSETIHVAEYGTGGLGKYENTVGVITELFIRLSKTDINRELLSKVEHIVEILNNLKHFQVDMREKTESEIVQEILAKFDTFNYQTLENLDLSNDFKLSKAENIDDEEVETFIQEGKLEEYRIAKEEKYDRVRVSVITRDKTRRVASILKDGEPQTVIDEMIDGLSKISRASFDRKYLKEFCFFTMSVDGIHSEISVIIEQLKCTLNHIFNSYSYGNKGYYDFDAFEIERRLDFDLDKFLGHAKNVANFQVGESLKIK